MNTYKNQNAKQISITWLAQIKKMKIIIIFFQKNPKLIIEYIVIKNKGL